MKRIVLAIALFAAAVLCGGRLCAQEISEQTSVRDTIIYRMADAVDSTLVGISILNAMPSRSKGNAADVNINQSPRTTEGLNKFIGRNKDRVIPGYRVRIFFDNKQTARAASETAMNTFLKSYLGIPAYRTYQSPFFKVTVGDFRTKSEAMVLLRSLKNQFPAAFIVKENINYPAADRIHTFVTDTIRIETPQL
ncbi:MAG: SPOR domain-containing protein [Bacteroidales bacterium]|nr:SPOR domain-containing protein [Bacteroidales bacterium]